MRKQFGARICVSTTNCREGTHHGRKIILIIKNLAKRNIHLTVSFATVPPIIRQE